MLDKTDSVVELTQLMHGATEVVVGLLALPSQVQVRVQERDALHAHISKPTIKPCKQSRKKKKKRFNPSRVRQGLSRIVLKVKPPLLIGASG